VSDINDLLRQQKRSVAYRQRTLPSYSSTDSTAQSTDSASSQARRHLEETSGQIYGDIFQKAPRESGFLRDGQIHVPAESMSLDAIADQLPTGKSCDVLIRAYFKGYHTVKPLLNGHFFLEESSKIALW
jgi:hypothetical protein